MAASFRAGRGQIAETGPGGRGGAEYALPVDEAVIVSVPSPGGVGQPERAASVQAALVAHPGRIFVLPSGRRIPVDTLLDHLAETGGETEWAGDECEVCYAATIEPWAAPSSAPCWERMRGPLWHLWSLGTPEEPRKLIGLIIADQRLADRSVEIEPLLCEEPADERPAPACQIELSDLVVAGEYHPRLAENDPAILALTPPEGENWQPRWWKLGNRPLWQYGWWR